MPKKDQLVFCTTEKTLKTCTKNDGNPMFLTAPLKKPQQFGFKKGDTHLVVNAATKTAKAYDHNGKLLWVLPCLAEGQDPNWRNNSGDTPPGLYKLGAVYNDYARVGASPSYDRTLLSYGWISFDMVDLEGNEDGNNRAGIMLHGGGSAAGWPGAWRETQPLYATLGCLRMHNIDLRDKVLPLRNQGTVFVSVYQDEA
ncbi:MAG: L,D-transpeptidase [Cetobacterium sp.]